MQFLWMRNQLSSAPMEEHSVVRVQWLTVAWRGDTSAWRHCDLPWGSRSMQVRVLLTFRGSGFVTSLKCAQSCPPSWLLGTLNYYSVSPFVSFPSSWRAERLQQLSQCAVSPVIVCPDPSLLPSGAGRVWGLFSDESSQLCLARSTRGEHGWA